MTSVSEVRCGRKRSIKADCDFMPEQLAGWSCHHLRRGRLWVELVLRGRPGVPVGRVGSEVSNRYLSGDAE